MVCGVTGHRLGAGFGGHEAHFVSIPIASFFGKEPANHMRPVGYATINSGGRLEIESRNWEVTLTKGGSIFYNP
jgi:hypothetical protein